MNICLVSTQLGIGGAETQVCNLADKLTSLGHSVCIISLLGQPSSRPINLNVSVISLNMNKRNLLSIIEGIVRFYKYTKQFKPDVVHSHAVHANLFCRIMRPLLNFPVLVSTAHSNNEGGKILMLLYRVTDFLANITTNVSDAAVGTYISKGVARKRKIRRVYNGIDTEYFKFSSGAARDIRRAVGVDESTTLLLAVGRLSVEKDYPNLFHALSALMNSGRLDRDWRLLVAGSGRMQPDLESLVQALGMAKHVIFLGIRKDLPSLMSAADVFVLSSKWEGFGLVIAEAMACECIVVATDCGGTREVIGGKGFICEPSNSKSLALAIENGLLLDVGRRKVLGREARNRIVSEFSLDHIANQWVDLYKSLHTKIGSARNLD